MNICIQKYNFLYFTFLKHFFNLNSISTFLSILNILNRLNVSIQK